MGSRNANNVDLILLQCVSFLFLWATDCRWTVTGSEKWFVYFRGRLTHPVLVAAITYAISSNRKQLLKYYRQPAALNCRTPPSVRCWLCVCHQQNKQLNTVYMWLRRSGFGGGGVWSRVLTAAPRTPWPESGCESAEIKWLLTFLPLTAWEFLFWLEMWVTVRKQRTFSGIIPFNYKHFGTIVIMFPCNLKMEAF